MEGWFNIEARVKYLPYLLFPEAEASKAKAAKRIAPWVADDFLDWAAIHPSLWTSSGKFFHDFVTCSSHVPSLNAVHPTTAKIIDIEAFLNFFLNFILNFKNAPRLRKSQSKMSCMNEN